MQAWKSRYKDLKEFSALVDMIEEVEHKLPKKLAS